MYDAVGCPDWRFCGKIQYSNILRLAVYCEVQDTLVSKEKRAKQVSISVKKTYKRYITTWEANNENVIEVCMNLFGKKLCILGIYAISEDENILVKEDFFGKLNE
jgi:hypothetical protein